MFLTACLLLAYSYTAVLHGVPVISFEALPHNVERMRRLIEKYRMGDLMTVVHGAVWSVGGMEVVFRNQVSVLHVLSLWSFFSQKFGMGPLQLDVFCNATIFFWGGVGNLCTIPQLDAHS